jgi:cation diffusion facilitator family transporter
MRQGQSKHPGLSARAVSWIGLLADLVLSAGKIGIGVLFSSQALLADGLHSGSDLVTDVAVLAGLGVSKKPADDDHPYGHRRVGTLVTMFIGAALLLAASYIIYNAIMSLQRGATGRVEAFWPLMMAGATVPIKEMLFRLSRTAGRREEETSLIANAWHHRTDAFSSVAAAAGLAGVALGGNQWAFLDAVTATVLGAFLLVVALRILKDAAGELIDRAPNQAVHERMRQAVLSTEGVQDFHALRARRSGGKIVADVHILVDPMLTVHEGHEIARTVRKRIFEQDPDVIEVIVHTEPYHAGPWRSCPIDAKDA